MSDINTSGVLTDEEKLQLLEGQQRIFFHTDYLCLLEHNGFRPGKTHLVLGTTGGGKSTLVRSWVFDALKFLPDEGKILIWLSEETREEFLVEMYLSGYDQEKAAKQLIIFSELELPDSARNVPLHYLRERIFLSKATIVFFDNLTTSCFYMDHDIQEQSYTAIKLKEVAIEYNVPLILIAHTGALVNDNINRLITLNDIRGSKSIVNIAHFAYILQRFQIDQKFFPTIRLVKYRGQSAENFFFRLRYCYEKRLYIEDRQISWEEFHKEYKKRNKLS